MMKDVLKRTIAAVTLASMILPFAACNKTGGGSKDAGAASGAGDMPASGEAVSADSPWYDMTTIRISTVDNPDDFQYNTSSFVGVLNEKYSYYVTGLMNYPEGVDDNNFTDEVYYDTIDVYSEDGTKLSSVDLREKLLAANLGEHTLIDSVSKVGDSIFVSLSAFTDDYATVNKYETTVDVETGTIGDIIPSTNPYINELNELGAGEETPIVINGYLIQPYWVSDTCMSYIFIVTDPSGNISKIDLRDQMPMTPVWRIRGVWDLGNNKLLAYGDSENGDVFIDIDLTSMTASQSTQDYSWISSFTSNFKTVDGLGTVVVDGTSISRVNFENGTEEEIFNYANTNANRSEVSSLTPVFVSDEKVVLTGQTIILDSQTLSYDFVPVVKIFTKAETNPNAGKTYLTLTSTGGYTPGLCNAVCQFNDSSSEFFIVFDPRYDLNNFIDSSDFATSDDIQLAYDNGLIQLGNQLSIDVMSGDGPDILIGSSMGFPQLNNPDYLVDLGDYVQSNLTEDRYMRNVIDACCNDGHIYQLPLNFTVRGIVTQPSFVSEGQAGLTFDQYGALVSGACNGTDPIAQSKMDFFITVLSSSMDLMKDENGNINFNNEAFRSLATYTSDNVLDVVVNENDDQMPIPVDDCPTHEITVYGPRDFFDSVSDGDVIVGYPSYDGRGPIIGIGMYVGISAQSASVDGCMKFLDYLTSPETQILFSEEDGTPICRESIEAECNICIENHNSEIQRYLINNTEAELRSWGLNPTMMDSSTTTAFMNLINSVDGRNISYDGSINMIVREEMPAYFEGQKSLDEVITIIQDRAQTVVSERS